MQRLLRRPPPNYGTLRGGIGSLRATSGNVFSSRCISNIGRRRPSNWQSQTAFFGFVPLAMPLQDYWRARVPELWIVIHQICDVDDVKLSYEVSWREDFKLVSCVRPINNPVTKCGLHFTMDRLNLELIAGLLYSAVNPAIYLRQGILQPVRPILNCDFSFPTKSIAENGLSLIVRHQVIELQKRK